MAGVGFVVFTLGWTGTMQTKRSTFNNSWLPYALLREFEASMN